MHQVTVKEIYVLLVQIRATHGCHEGSWYYEVTVERLGDTGHCRVGWATKRAEVQAPVGFDQYGFSYRDILGTKQHKALRENYGDGFAEGEQWSANTTYAVCTV